MKKLVMFVALMLVGGVAYAGAPDPCRNSAYLYCSYKLQYISTQPGPSGSLYCVYDSGSAEAKACEADARTRCKAGEVLDTSWKSCQ